MGPEKYPKPRALTKKRTRNTIELKKEIVEKYELGIPIAEIARRYGKPPSTISSIVMKREAINEADVAKGVNTLTKQRSQTIEKVEQMLLVWIEEQQLDGKLVPEPAIRDEARRLYADLVQKSQGAAEEEDAAATTSDGGERQDFKASRGWLENFKRRIGRDGTSTVTHVKREQKGLQSPSVNTVSHIASLSLDSKLAILHELDNDRTELFVSQLFNVPKKVVRQIRLEGDEIRAMALGRKAPSSPDTRLERLEEILSKWIMSNLPNDFRMSSVFVRQLAQNMYKSMAEAVGNDPDVFRASKEWLWQFVRRYGLDCLTWVEEDTVNVTSSSSSCSVDQLMADARGEEMPKVDVDQDAKLIASVEQNRCLYDPEDLDYKNDVMKENVWQKIAKSIDTTVEKAKARWQNLELLYQKSLNSVNKIHMFGKMSFLRPHLNLETREDLKPSEERSPISIKAECISSDDEEFADTVEATPSNMGAVGLIMVDPYRKSRVPLVTYENQHERSLPEDLDMKVEEEIEEEEEEEEAEEENSDMHGEPQNSTSCNSSLCHIPPSDTSFIEAKLQEVSASMAKKRKYTKKLLKSEAPKPDQDLEYFKGFMSMIKELTAKRKRQLFASFAQELFRLLEEQEREESESTET